MLAVSAAIYTRIDPTEQLIRRNLAGAGRGRRITKRRAMNLISADIQLLQESLPEPAAISMAARSVAPTAHLKWTPTYNLHLTTKFIGEWPESQATGIIDHLEAAGKRARACRSLLKVSAGFLILTTLGCSGPV